MEKEKTTATRIVAKQTPRKIDIRDSHRHLASTYPCASRLLPLPQELLSWHEAALLAIGVASIASARAKEH